VPAHNLSIKLHVFAALCVTRSGNSLVCHRPLLVVALTMAMSTLKYPYCAVVGDSRTWRPHSLTLIEVPQIMFDFGLDLHVVATARCIFSQIKSTGVLLTRSAQSLLTCRNGSDHSVVWLVIVLRSATHLQTRSKAHTHSNCIRTFHKVELRNHAVLFQQSVICKCKALDRRTLRKYIHGRASTS
jgi:hypothetical protein